MSHWTGINALSRERFGRALWDLSVAELTDLYRDLGMMPAPAAELPVWEPLAGGLELPRPHLRLVRDGDERCEQVSGPPGRAHGGEQ